MKSKRTNKNKLDCVHKWTTYTVYKAKCTRCDARRAWKNLISQLRVELASARFEANKSLRLVKKIRLYVAE